MENVSLQLKSIPEELGLILEIIKNKHPLGETSNKRVLFSLVDWNKFMQLARHHRLFPILCSKLKKIGDDLIPFHVIETLQKDYKHNTIRMLHLSGEMEQVCKLFAENKVSTIVLKGPVLAADLYGDISLRTSCDLDILVPINELDKVQTLLLSRGYVKDDYFETVLNDWKWRHHHITFFHPYTGVKLEIHWRLNPGPAPEPKFYELWSRRRKSSISDFPIFILGREDLFLFLISHGARHGWSRLRWLMDIDCMVKQGMNETILESLLRKYHYSHIAGQAILLASQLLDSPIPEELETLAMKPLAKALAQEAIFYLEEMVELHKEPLPEHVATYHKRHLFSLMSTQQKILFLLSCLYPYSMDVKTLPLPKNLHFLYFPLRPILWVWRKTTNQAGS